MPQIIEDKLRVDGLLTVETTRGSYDLLVGQTAVKEIDLSQVKRADSAALALLLAAQRRADRAGQPLHVTGAPVNLGVLAQLYGVSDWINLA